MKRSPELEALADNDETVVADNTVRRKQLVGGAVLVLLGLVAGYLVLSGGQPPVRDMLDGDEEFNHDDISSAVLCTRRRAGAGPSGAGNHPDSAATPSAFPA